MEQCVAWSASVHTRVARWYIFKPKIPIWVNFVGPCNGRRKILRQFGVFLKVFENGKSVQNNFGLLFLGVKFMN
jgi:hypothetical protein